MIHRCIHSLRNHSRLFLCALLVLLVGADFLCYQQVLPIELDIQNFGITTLHVGSEKLILGRIGRPIALRFALHDSVVHEYQLDGTDSTNNLTLNQTYLDGIASSPYYRFQAWMRDLDGTSRWSDLHIYGNNRLLTSIDWPENGSFISLASVSSSTQTQHLSLALHRPETPMSFSLLTSNNTNIQVTIDRNDRKIEVRRQTLSANEVIASSFFPVDPLPFAAMVLDTILRVLIATILVFLIVQFAEIVLTSFLANTLFPLTREAQKREPALEPVLSVRFRNRKSVAASKALSADVSTLSQTARIPTESQILGVLPVRRQYGLLRAIHPVGLLALAGSLCFVAWIAKVQYNAEPHTFDASAYLFMAKIYATGHLSVPIPPAIDRFPGPFMVKFAGRWFGQYPPGTPLALVPGLLLGVPWLVEPILGTLSLLAIGLIAARLFDRRVATLTVILGALSPFYSYLAASYLSHAVALFFLSWGFWALLRFAQDRADWNLPLAALLFGMASQTRDQVALLYTGIILVGILLLYWRNIIANWHHWVIPGLYAFAIAFAFFSINIYVNMALTHNPWETPRLLFYAPDHWGFGMGVGFYGEHTFAAGLVNLDELLTILSIDLYGWPFYFTLAFVALPFLTLRATAADWLLLISEIILTGAYVGYFYHGIYLGPRYLFETLPFLLILTAHGIFVLADASKTVATRIWRYSKTRPREPLTLINRVSIPTTLLVLVLVLSNLMYFLPRQIEIYRSFSGINNRSRIDLNQIYHPSLPLHNAIVVTDDSLAYQLIYFPLNDPYLRGDVLYAFATTTADYNELRADYPDRRFYYINIAPDGSVQYTLLNI